MSTEIRRRTTGYLTAKQKALRSVDADEVLFWTCVAATSAWRNPFGRWHDPELDSRLRNTASQLDVRPDKLSTNPSGIAHITSTIADGGGHMETLLLWCENIGGEIISSQWEESAKISDPSLQQLKSRAYLCPIALRPAQKAKWIVEKLIERQPQRVLLHINPNDVVALAAAVKYREISGAEIFFYDHVDTSYWLGSSLVDRVIEIRPSGATIAREFREVPESKIGHVPLTSRTRHSPSVTRTELELPDSSTVSLTVAAYYKMRPDGHWNFAQTINRILDNNPNHYHLVVGHGSAKDGEMIRSALARQQVRVLGRRSDVDALLRISDFVIESFPLMGGLFRLDAMREGVPLVAIAHPQWPQVFDMGVFPPGYPLVASTNEEVAKLSEAMIADASSRQNLGGILRDYYETNFSAAAISQAMRGALTGKPMAIPASPASVDQEWFALMLNPEQSDYQAIVNWVSANLHYSPPLSFSERLNYWRSYIGSALAARLKHASN